MRLLIDSNQLQSDRLREFLSKSLSNQAILTDFIAMEAYKGDSLNSIFKSMDILSCHPKQVVILKGSRKLFGCSGRLRGLQRRLIDEGQTSNFARYTKELKLAANGDPKMQYAILKHGKEADKHFQSMLAETDTFKTTVDILINAFSKEERAILKTQGEYTSELANKVISTVIEISGEIAVQSNLVSALPSFEELPNTYYFRLALAIFLLGITRASQSDIKAMRPDKLRNDLVDMTLVASASYFDGILSADERLLTMYKEVCLILSALMDAHVPSLRYWAKKASPETGHPKQT